MLFYPLRFRLSRSRRRRLSTLPLASHQVYPEGPGLNPEFLTSPLQQEFVLQRQTPVSSMGSCFAREIKKRLVVYVFSESGTFRPSS